MTNSEQIEELVRLAEGTSFEQVQLYLLEKKEEYVKCLHMLIKEHDKKLILADSSLCWGSVAVEDDMSASMFAL
jgi:hypothetical protein